jgi:hypothetical protein
MNTSKVSTVVLVTASLGVLGGIALAKPDRIDGTSSHRFPHNLKIQK